MQPGSITRRVAALAAALLALGAAAPPFTEAPEYLRLFAPRAHRDTYRTAVSPLGIDAVLAALAEDESLVRDGGAWRPRHELPQDAFGRSGDYNLWTLNRLYGGSQPRVARGPRLQDGRVAESWILVSPYPDPTLTRLEAGTLRMIVTIP